MEPASERPRQSVEDDQPSTSIQSGDEEVENHYIIWTRDTRTFKKNLSSDISFKIKFNDQWRGGKLIDIYNQLHDMFDDVLSQA